MYTAESRSRWPSVQCNYASFGLYSVRSFALLIQVNPLAALRRANIEFLAAINHHPPASRMMVMVMCASRGRLSCLCHTFRPMAVPLHPATSLRSHRSPHEHRTTIRASCFHDDAATAAAGDDGTHCHRNRSGPRSVVGSALISSPFAKA